MDLQNEEMNLADETSAKLVDELTATYRKLNGFILVYHASSSNKEKKAAKIEVGMDKSAGIGFAQLTVEGDHETPDIQRRIWTTSLDKCYVGNSEEQFVSSGFLSEIAAHDKIWPNLADKNGKQKDYIVRWTPSAELTDEGINLGMGFSSLDVPHWLEIIDGFTHYQLNEEEVTFLSPAYGLIAIDREYGLMLKQSLKNKGGELRDIELTEVKANPENHVVAKFIAAWPIQDAQKVSHHDRIQVFRLELLAVFYAWLLEKDLEEQELFNFFNDNSKNFRELGKIAIDDSKGTFASKVPWEKVVKEYQDAYVQRLKEGAMAAADADAIRGVVDDPEVRQDIIAQFVQILTGIEGGRDAIMQEIFGPQVHVVTSPKDDNEKSAKIKALTKAVIERSYLEVIAEMKIDEHWQR